MVESELITAKYMITYKTLTQEAFSEYLNLAYYNYWEPEDNTKDANDPELSWSMLMKWKRFFKIPKIGGIL